MLESDQVPTDAARLVAGCGGHLSRSYAPNGVVSVDGDAAFAGRIAGDERVFAVGPEHVSTASDPLMQEATPAVPAAQPCPRTTSTGCGPGAVCDPGDLILNAYLRPDSGAAAYAGMGGTSMAAPHASAVAAQVRSMPPSWTTGHVRAWLKSSAQNLGDRQYFGAGMLDAGAARR